MVPGTRMMRDAKEEEVVERWRPDFSEAAASAEVVGVPGRFRRDAVRAAAEVTPMAKYGTPLTPRQKRELVAVTLMIVASSSKMSLIGRSTSCVFATTPAKA